MITNTDATLFVRKYNPSTRLDEWERLYIPKAWWFTDSKATMTTDGMQVGDITTVRIPDASIKVKKDDYLVKGNHPTQITTVKDLVGKEHIKITSVNTNTFGDNPHIKVVGV